MQSDAYYVISRVSDLEASSLANTNSDIFLADMTTSLSFTFTIDNIAAVDSSNDIQSVLAGDVNYEVSLQLSDVDIAGGDVDTLG